MRGGPALTRFLECDFFTVLDIGSGQGPHAELMRRAGRVVTTVDRNQIADVRADYMAAEFREPFDAVWCCHVLEHQRNPGAFLDKVRRDCVPGGVICITVPPLKHNIVGGHVTLWNEGLLLYHLILAGIDCSKARVGVEAYDISVIVRNESVPLPILRGGKGDIEALAKFFPVKVSHGFDGRIGSVNW